MTWKEGRQFRWPYKRGIGPVRKDELTVKLEPIVPGDEEYSGCFTVTGEPPSRLTRRRRHGPACRCLTKGFQPCKQTAAAHGVCVSHLRAIGGHLWGRQPYGRDDDRWIGICRACGARQHEANVLTLCPARAGDHPAEAPIAR